MRNLLLMAVLSISLSGFAQSNTSKLIPSDCGLNDVHYGQMLTAEQVNGATKYEFRLRNSDISYWETLQKSSRIFQLNELPTTPADGETYDVDVRVKQGNTFGGWGQVCQINVNDHPNTELILPDCGKQNVKAKDELQAKSVNGAIQYQFEITDMQNGAIYQLTKPQNTFSIQELNGVFTDGSDLNIRIRTDRGSGFGGWGLVCTIRLTQLNQTSLLSQYCNATVNFSDVLIFNKVPLAHQYEVWLHHAISGDHFKTITNNQFDLHSVLGSYAILGGNYEVRIRPLDGAIKGSFGGVCNLSATPPSGFCIEYSVNGGTYSSGITTPKVCQGDTVCVRVCAADSWSNSCRVNWYEHVEINGDWKKGILLKAGSPSNRSNYCFTVTGTTYLWGEGAQSICLNRGQSISFSLLSPPPIQAETFSINKDTVCPEEVLTINKGFTATSAFNVNFDYAPANLIANNTSTCDIAYPFMGDFTITKTVTNVCGTPVRNSSHNVHVKTWEECCDQQGIIPVTGLNGFCLGISPTVCIAQPSPNAYYVWIDEMGNTTYANCINPTTAGTYILKEVTATGCIHDTINIIGDCCFDDSTTAITVLSGTYTSMPIIANGSSVYMDGTVTFSGLTFNLQNVEFLADGELILENCNATFSNCNFHTPCDNIWSGILPSGTTLLTIQGGAISDALRAIEVSSQFDNGIQLDLSHINFINNDVGIYFDDPKPFAFQNISGISIRYCMFNNTNLKYPFPLDYVPSAGVYFNGNSNDITGLRFSNCAFTNMEYGIYANSSRTHFNVNDSYFTNTYVGGIYYDAPLVAPPFEANHDNQQFIISNCHFNNGVLPNTLQFSGVDEMYGVKTPRSMEVRNGCTFNGQLQMTNAISTIGISADWGAKNKTVTIPLSNSSPNQGTYQSVPSSISNATFTNLTVGISLIVVGFEDEGRQSITPQLDKTYMAEYGTDYSITSNVFEGNMVGIFFRRNDQYFNYENNYDPRRTITSYCSDCPNPRRDLIHQEISCNEFIKGTPFTTAGGQTIGLFVDNNTLMNDIGDCDPNTALSPAGNQFPIDGSLDRSDPTFTYNDYLPEVNWISILSNTGSGFDYYAFHNEYLGSNLDVIGIQHPENHKNPNGVCFLQTAPLNLCGDPNIVFPLLRPSDSELATNSISNEIEYELGNAYPNPATNTFTVPFNINTTYKTAVIEVFDIKSTNALVSIPLTTNSGKINISSEKLVNGLYLYRLVIDHNYVQTKNIIIAK